MMSTESQPRDSPVPPGLLLCYLVVLAGTDPLVWRRIRVPAAYSFWDLHVAIQDAMGWLDYHLHHFRVLDLRSGTSMTLGIPDPDAPNDLSVIPDWTEFPLDFTSGSPAPIHYTYDFGDDWDHAVIFEAFDQGGIESLGPECVGGAGACPPEDCGGAQGYANLLIALADPDHPEHKDMMEWTGGPIDAAAFSVADVHFDDPAERWDLVFGDDAI